MSEGRSGNRYLSAATDPQTSSSDESRPEVQPGRAADSQIAVGTHRQGPLLPTERTRTVIGEKERVYSELDDLRNRVFHLRREIKTLRSRGTSQDAADMRREAQHYRKALSEILHRLDSDDLPPDVLRRILKGGLDLAGMKASKRKRIERLRDA
jgi:hypothetical protein